MFAIFKRLRRKRILQQPFPIAWRPILLRNVAYYCFLTLEDQRELEKHIQIFLAEKSFEGCGGLKITDEMRVTIAAQACILLLHRKHDYYAGLDSILVYPHSFWVKRGQVESAGVVSEFEEALTGEAWSHGAVVLSWDEIRHTTREPRNGQNIVLHEFAHILDWQDGCSDGAPLLESSSGFISWARILNREYQALVKADRQGKDTLINPYGATDPAEFFAVVTECFFETPLQFRARHPMLYKKLSAFYCQDPAAKMAIANLNS